jgi:hypothetical protein
MVGGQANSLVAFSQKDGAVVWKKHDFKNSTSSPIVINVDGQDQLVAFMYSDVVGVDANNGNLLWSQPHKVEYGLNTSTPVWGDEDGHLLLSTVTPEGLKVISKVALLSNQSWTVPALVGTRLYLRDRKNIMAVDLGAR